MDIPEAKDHIQKARTQIKEKMYKEADGNMSEALKYLETQKVSQFDPLAFVFLLLILIGYALS